MSAAELPLAKAVRDFPLGAVFAFPTDTVYGLGVRANDQEAIQKLRALKSRPAPAPFSLHLRDVVQLQACCAPLSRRQRQWIAQLLPGPYTVLLPAGKGAPKDAVMQGKIGIRVPAGAAFSYVARAFGALLGTSVNRAGAPPLNDPEAILKVFGQDIALLVTTEAPFSAISSAVLDLCVDPPQAVRGQLPADLAV